MQGLRMKCSCPLVDRVKRATGALRVVLALSLPLVLSHNRLTFGRKFRSTQQD